MSHLHDGQVLVYQQRLDFCQDCLDYPAAVADRYHDYGWKGCVGFVGFQGQYFRFDPSGQVHDLSVGLWNIISFNLCGID